MSKSTWAIKYVSPDTNKWEYIRNNDTGDVMVFSEKLAHEQAEFFRSGGNDSVQAVLIEVY